jgi:hypothetical protein
VFPALSLAVCAVVLAAGCGVAGRDAAGASVPLPTLTLIAATATPTPTRVPPTLSPTPETGFFASTLSAPTATPADETASANEAASADPVAQSLAALAQRLLAETLDLPVRRVRVVSITPYTWPDASLGCPLPDQAYAQVLSNGYRIVLAAGDREYAYHSDVDRVVSCPAEFEQLPAGTPTPPPAATAPAVPPQAVG